MKLLNSFMYTVNYLAEHGELLKAYFVLRFAPSYIEDKKEVKDLLKQVQERMKQIYNMNEKGYLDTKEGLVYANFGGIDPPDVDALPRFQILLKDLKKLKLNYIVDVGCFSGWLGRRLSLEGIKVLGIDMQPGVIEVARIRGAGSLAEFKCINAQTLGIIHKDEFDCAVLFDIIEHTVDPENMIKSVEMSVKKGGWVFLTIPKVEEEHRITKIPPMDRREHMQSFTEKRIRKMFGKKKSFSMDSIDNEEGVTNWYVKYQI